MAVLFSLFSCAKYEYTGGVFDFSEPGVYGYITPIEIEGAPGTKATVDPRTMIYHFEVGDRINIWSSTGTTLLYNVEAVNAEGRATFSGGGFTLAEGETYYSSHPLIRSTADDYKSLSTSYEGQIQKANDNANHIADYTYTYSSAICENGNTSFQYHHLCSFFLFHVTLPEAMTLKELSITAVDGNDSFFALDGKADVSNGSFVPGRTADTMTLGLDNIQVDDKVLWAYLSVAPVPAGKYIVRVKDSEDHVYTSLQISQNAVAAGKGAWFVTEVFPGENPPVAQIGDELFYSLEDAVAAVPIDGTQTTITMIGDETINVVGSAITVANTKNIILDLNGHQVVGVAEGGSTSALITNQGTLTIKDSSDSKADGTGSGQLISGATTNWIYDGSGNFSGSYASNTITNTGTLTVESGYIENLSTGSATYAVDNNSGSRNAILNVTGGKLTAARTVVRQFCNSTTSQNVVNISGGTIETNGSAAMWTQLPGSSASSKKLATLNITGGTIKGTSYAWYDYSFGDSFEAVNYSISGVKFDGNLYSFAVEDGIKPGFITGGVFASLTYVEDGETLDCDWMSLLADGYIVAPNTDPETSASYPYTVIEDTNVYVAQIGGTKYLTLEAAIAAVPTDGTTTTITLLTALTLDDMLVIGDGKSIELDLDGNTLTGDIDQYDSSLEVKNGTLAGTVYVNGGTSGTNYNTFTLASGATIDSEFAIVLYQSSNNTAFGSTIDINGTVNGVVWVMGNITDGNSVVNVNSGATVKGDLGVALNGFATLNVYDGATVEGSESGIEVRAGNLNVTGGNIKSTATEYTVTSNGSGTTTFGAAIAVAQHTTNLAINASVSGATLSGIKTISVADPQGTGMDNVSVTVSDTYLDNNVAIPSGFKWVSNGNGTSTLNPVTNVAKIGDVEYETLADAIDAVPADGTATTITMIGDETIEANAGVTIPAGKNVVLDLNSKTIKGIVQSPATAQVILNKGTLTITDSSNEKRGTLTNEVSDENAGSPMDKNWYSDVITNNGTLTVNAGNLVNTGTGGACYAIDNITNGTTCTPTVNIAGGNISAKKVAVRMFCNSTTNVNTVNVTGGNISSELAYGIQTQQANKNANKAALNITGGFISGQYAWADYGDKNTPTQFDNTTYNITGGFFTGYLWSYATYYCGMDGFISGGYFNIENGGDLVVPGFAFADNTDPETKDNYPYTIGLAEVYYSWISGGVVVGDYCTFAAPFVNGWLMDGEFITLQKDISLTKNIECLLESGTFSLTLGNYSITKGSYSVSLKSGVSVKTDKQTDIFSAEDGSQIVETAISDGDFHYQYSVASNAAKIGNVEYETLEAAFAAVQDGQTITLMADCAGNGIVAPQGKFPNGITIDFNNHTYTMDGAMVGSTGTQTQAFQLLTGNSVTFKNGTLVSTKVSMMIQNYCNLTLENMVIDGSQAPNCSYVLSNNHGAVNIIGSTSITAASGKNAFDVCWAPKNGYPGGAQVTVNTTGTITGKIEYDLWGGNQSPVLSTLNITAGNFVNYEIVLVGTADFTSTASDNIQITGGSFDSDPSTYVANGYSATLSGGKYTVAAN